MSSIAISLIILLCLTAGFLLGMWLQHRLPDHHLSKESQDTVKLGSGMVATMSALILGLLVSSAKNTFDAMNLAIAQNGARIIQLDHYLAEYGPESRPIRDQLKTSVALQVDRVWHTSAAGGSGLRAVEKSTTMIDLQASLRALVPQNERQKSSLSQIQQVCSDFWQNRLLIMEQQQQPVTPVFVVLLAFWLAMLFLSFGLYAPRNATVLAVLLVCAFSVSSAVFLILEMSHPLDGIIKVSNAPMLKALELIGQ
ncbi:MAG: hypothetical protein WCP35_09210 [Verrucomicrobiota bacterium]